MKTLKLFTVHALVVFALCSISVFGQGSSCGSDDYDCKVTEATGRITVNPKDVEAYYVRAAAHNRLKNFDLAIADATKYISLGPAQPEYRADGYFLRGNANRDKGNLEQAIADFTSAIKDNPKLTNAYINRGLVYYRQLKAELALADLNKAVSVDPSEAEGYYNRGLVHDLKKQYDLAIADYDKYISLNPDDKAFLADGYANRGVAYFNKGDNVRALRDLTTSIEFNPERVKSYRSRADVYRKMGKTALAVADDQKADELSK